LTSDEVQRGVTWTGTTGTVEIYDRPNAQNYIQEIRFETIVIVTNHDGNGNDKVLGSYTWGWTDSGSTSINPSGTVIYESGTVSDTALEIIKTDYPNYNPSK
jgi:hypothetical protein